MIDRRRFVFGCLAASAAGPAIAAEGAPTGFQTPQFEGDYPIPEEFWVQVVRVRDDFPAGQIHIVPQTRFLYLTLGNATAIRYGVAIGRESLRYSGESVVGRKVEWPSWRPTPEMIARNPDAYARYADGMPGGPSNPLGARALYLYQNGYDTAIRIHGTTEPQSIGKAVSNGCFRMYNSHVVDLYDRVPMGTPVFAY